MNNLQSGIRVVSADDHAVVRAGIRLFLEQAEDIEVIGEACDGEIAVGMIRDLQPDIVILDIQMIKATGIDVLREIRARRWRVGVLILTAYDDEPYGSAVLKAGANGYVLKTAPPHEIIAAVRQVYHGKSVLDATILQKVLSQIANPDPQALIEPLTDREIEVLTQVATGLENKAVGIKLQISDRTVQGHIARIFEKLQASSRTEAVMRAIAQGLIHIPNLMNEEQAFFDA